MAFWDRITRAIALNPTLTDNAILHERAIDSFADDPDMQTQLEMVFARRRRAGTPWRVASMQEALGVPAIFRSVTLISNTVGALAVEAFRNGVKLPDEQRPRLIVRPNPLQAPRTFYRDTAWYIATEGRVWWNVAHRDSDDNADALIVVPPSEVTVTPNENDRFRPIITWLGRRMRNEDMRCITYTPSGQGPLQLNQAAVSVAVEAQEWAANFYAYGGYPNLWIKAAGSLSGDPDMDDEDNLAEIQRLKAQWIETAPNTPKITDESIESIQQFDPNPQSAGMLAARSRADTEAAQMFGVPGALLEAIASGSSLTYQNLAEVWTSFTRGCLAPHYLEPIEQELSDLLTRSTVARFNVKGLLRADAKTRAEVYALLVPLGIITAEQAAAEEGYLPGDVEFAPVPFAPPAAIPAPVPLHARSLEDLRCKRCGGLAGRVGGPAEIKCRKCGQLVVAA